MATDTPLRGRIIRRFVRWTGGAVFALALLLVLGFGALQTGLAKTWLAATLSNAASEAMGFTVRIDAIEGTVPTDFSVAAVEIADAGGVWLMAEDVALAWQPLDLFAGRLSVARLSASRVDVARAPVTIDAPAEPEPASAPLAIELPELPLAVSIADVEIGEIRLGASLVGEEIAAAAFGSAALGARPQEAEIALTVLRLDGVPARLELTLAQAPDRRLRLEAMVEEPAGGLIARLLDLPGLPAVALRLTGSGPVTGWTGRLDATAGDAAAGLDLSLALDDRVDLALAGSVDPGGLAGPGLRDLLPRPIAIDAALGWTPGEALSIDRAALSAPGLDATVQGTIDQAAETIDATIELAATDAALIARLADPVRAEAVHATARVSGDLTAPMLAIEATADQLAAPGAMATAVTAEVSLAPTDDPARFALSARIAPQGLVVDGDPSLVALVGAAPLLAVDGMLDPAAGRLDMAHLDVTGAALRATGSGHVAEEGRDLDLTLAVRLDDLAPLGDLAGQAMGGALDADLHVVGDATAPALAVDLDARGDDVALADPLLAAIVGTAPQLVAAATLDGDVVSIDSARLTAAAVTADATGTVGETIALTIDASTPDLAVLSASIGTDFAGGLTVSAQVSGPADDPAVAARLSGSRMVVAGVALGDPTADLTVAGIAAAPQGTVALTAAPGGATLSADTAFRMASDGGMRLDGLKIAGAGGTRLAGDLVLGADGRVDGTLDGEIADLAAWQGLAGTPLAGAVGFRLSASAGQGQHLDLAATGRDLVLADAATIRALRLDAEIDDALAVPAIEARLAAEGVAADALPFDTVSATAQGALADLGWTLAASGAGEKPAAIDAEGRLALGDAGGTVTVATLAATLASIETELTQPATLAWDESGVRVDGVDAAVGDGRVSAAGRFATRDMALDATIADLPVGPLAALAGDLELDGRLSGTVALAGDPAAPQGRATLTLTELRQAGVDPAEAMPLSGAAQATLAGGRVDATARLAGQSGVALDATLSAPMAGDGPLDGKVTGSIDLALVPRVVDLRGDALSGQLDLDLALGGSLADPRASGRATIAGGAYESATQGTVLRDLALEVVGDNDRLRLAALSANDGSGGRISATGGLTLDGAAGFPLEATVTLDRFTALRRPDATVQASGKLDVVRAGDGGRIAGALSVDSAELRVPDRLGGEIVTLEVTEINLPPGRERHVPPPAAPASPLDLDIRVDVPGRAFLRGRGLDSEWRGRLQVAGTTAAPDITGNLTVVRGNLDLLGRNFRFDQGEVKFIGGGEIDPELAFTAQSEAEALSVQAAVSGTASAPSFALSSDPPLPQDEILARLLFGSSAASLTPVQAVQLAQTAASLSGRGSSVSVLDELRQGFGLDMLGVESGETVSASSLAVGKYLTDDVFVKMNQGLTPESRKIGVEVRVLPRITVESDVGAESQGSVGVNWKLDY